LKGDETATVKPTAAAPFIRETDVFLLGMEAVILTSGYANSMRGVSSYRSVI